MKALPMAQQTECGCSPPKSTPQSRKNQLSKRTYMVGVASTLVVSIH